MSSVIITETIVIINVILAYITSVHGVTISPQHLHLSKGDSSEKISCITSHSLSNCEFRVFDLTSRDLSKVVLNVKYAVRTLKSNQCYTTLASTSLEDDHYYIATCRVRSNDSDWSYASMSVYKSEMGKIPLTVPKPEVVLAYGDTLQVAVRVSGVQLRGCSFKQRLADRFVGLFNYDTGSVCKLHHCFYGDGQAAFQNTCGVTLYEATWDDNGLLLLRLEAYQKREISFVSVIVGAPPTSLNLTHEMDLDNGSVTLRAKCTVSWGRPAPNITWQLGGTVVPDEAVKSIASDEWVWPFEDQTVEQTLTLTLNDSLIGMEVQCSATHFALTEPLRNTFQIETYSSSPSTTLFTTSGASSPTSEPLSGVYDDNEYVFGGVTHVPVSISPQHLHFRYDTSEKITCQASQPISGCEFRLFDLTNGKPTQVVLEKKATARALTSGRCELTLRSAQLTINSYYITSCRVRSASSGWSYDAMSTYKSESGSFPLIIGKSKATGMPGSSVNVTIRRNGTGGGLTSCELKRPQSNSFTDLFRFDETNKTCKSQPEFYGEGEMPCGQICGVTLHKINQDDNGILVLRLATAHSSEISFVSVIVAQAPTTKLSHKPVKNADGSITLEANCTATGGRPAPVITWYLGDSVIPPDTVRGVVYKEWALPFQKQKVTQRLRLKLNASQVGQEVSCSVKQVDMNLTINKKFKMGNGRNAVPWLYVIIGILAALLALFSVFVVVYAWRKKLCCFVHTKTTKEASVKYRRSLDASLTYEGRSSQPDMGPRFTISSIDRTSAVTGLEYAEIRVSMVQHCVDKLEANQEALSAETGERMCEPMRPNSLYHDYNVKT